MARWFISFDAINPRDVHRRWKTGIQESHFRRLQHYGHEKSLARIVLVGKVLEEETNYIYEGWSRPDKDDCFVYAGHPGLDYKSATITTPPPPDMVFLIFILPDGTIDDWTWRPCKDNSDQPDGVDGEPIWTAPTKS